MQEITLTLPMLQDMELTASKTAAAMGEHIRMSPDKIDEVCLALVEACINAFEYSRASDQKVQVVFTVLGEDDDPRGLEIKIRDGGVGFDPGQVTKPDIDKKIGAARKRGWGLEIIHGLMDEVDIESDAGGTTVVMRKMR